MSELGRGAGQMRIRLAAAGAAALTVVAGLGVRAGTGGDLAKYAGDALYTVLVYALTVLVAGRVKPRTAAATALGISWAVEFSQLSDIPAELSRHSSLALLALGSTFNPPDLLCYAVGAAFAWLVHTLTGRPRGEERI